MNGLALCAGAGGLELGLHIARPDYRTVCYVEREAYAAATLVARMADKALDSAPIWDDLKTFRGREWRGVVDIVTAGYPCQFRSQASRGRSNAENLWPWVAKAIADVRPSLVFTENVARDPIAIRSLECLGYHVRTVAVSAADVGAPHVRERIFMLGVHTDSDGQSVLPLHAEACGMPEPCHSGRGPWDDPFGDLQLADGIPCELESAHLSGNSCIPLAAAYAYRTLSTRIDL